MLNFTTFLYAASEDSFIKEIRSLDHVKSVEEVSIFATDYRQFEIQFEQPVDHQDLGSEKFLQKLILLHRDFASPMVLQTSGYAIFGVRKTSVTKLFKTNQLQVEHRYFADSTPKSQDHNFLTIQQSAADFHAITMSFKKLYTKKWINTGASKGGMTSVYHHRFYPQDLDGTLALVAPLSYSKFDERYIDFVSKVGGNDYATCRQKLLDAQNYLLQHRENVLPTLTGTYKILKDKEIAFEHAVIELAFTFWQYSKPRDTECSNVPSGDDGISRYISFLSEANSVERSYADEGVGKFLSYYYQAGTQLGGPGADLQSLSKHLKFAKTYEIDSYVPEIKNIGFDYQAMLDVEGWAREAGKLMFVYGEFDPWSAGAFLVNESKGQSFKFIQPKGNHGSDLGGLTAADRKIAVKALAGWLGVSDVGELETEGLTTENTLESLEFETLKNQRNFFRRDNDFRR